MAGCKHRRQRSQPIEDEPGHRELRRLNEAFDARWRDWIREGGATAESEILLLTEIVYALSDIYARAEGTGLDFLRYLLGMALQEAKSELRARESHDYPMPPAR